MLFASFYQYTWPLLSLSSCRPNPPLDGLALDELLNLSNGVIQNLLLRLLVPQRSRHLLDHRSSQLTLLLLTLLTLISHPRVKNGLDLGGKLGSLTELKGSGLVLGGLLQGAWREGEDK